MGRICCQLCCCGTGAGCRGTSAGAGRNTAADWFGFARALLTAAGQSRKQLLEQTISIALTAAASRLFRRVLAIVHKVFDPVEISVAIDATHRRVLRFEYDALGRMTAIITPNGGKLVYSYADNQSEPVSFSTAEGAVFRYTYDGAGRRMSILNDRGEIHFTYNNLDYRTQVTDALGNITNCLFL